MVLPAPGGPIISQIGPPEVAAVLGTRAAAQWTDLTARDYRLLDQLTPRSYFRMGRVRRPAVRAACLARQVGDVGRRSDEEADC